MVCKTGQRRDRFGIKNLSAEAKNRKGGKPHEVVKVGSVSVPLYRHTNIVPRRDADAKIIYGLPRADGKPYAYLTGLVVRA